MAQTKAKNQMEFTSKEGNNYVFQKVRPIEWLELMDTTVDANGKRSQKEMYKIVVENVIVSPQQKLKDWEDFGELDEVVAAALRFQQGK